MINSRLGLFGYAATKFARSVKTPSRKLYTDHIYPYPFEYINNKIHPSQINYRETWTYPWWYFKTAKLADFGFKMFWTYWWYQLFCDPGVILGHSHFPDPSLWTNAELGVPSDDYGTYEDWVRNKILKEDSEEND